MLRKSVLKSILFVSVFGAILLSFLRVTTAKPFGTPGLNTQVKSSRDLDSESKTEKDSNLDSKSQSKLKTSANSKTNKDDELAKYKWTSRLLITPDKRSAELVKQSKLFHAETVENANRKLLFIQVRDSEQYGLSKDEFSLALVGLDGQIKERYNSVTPMSQIYTLIDSMPMQKSEQKKQK